MYQMCTKGTGDVFPQNRCAEVTPKKTGHTSTLGEASELSPKPLPQMSPRETWPSGKLHFGDLWCSTCPFCGELIYISCAHTHTLPLPHHLYKDPCFLASSLLNPDFVYIVVNTDFSGFWFPFRWSCLTERHELTKLKPQVKSLGGRNRSEASFTKAIFQIVWKWKHFLID